MNLNQQSTERINHHPDGVLEVHSIWDTIQGEGIYAGWPAVFVRLSGCNLQCPLCDTEYTSIRKLMTPDEIKCNIEKVADGKKRVLIVITGGEPFRQNIAPLCKELDSRYIVQIETNGSLPAPDGFVDFAEWDQPDVICSPKTAKLAKGIGTWVSAYKYVVEHGWVDPTDGLPLRVLGETCRVARPETNNPNIFVQPLDEQDEDLNKLHMAAAVKSCMDFGYTLCLQVHKYAGLK